MNMTAAGRKQIEVRPTLIVGIGGTGTLVCQKAYELMEKLPGGVPPFLRFVVLDTDRQEEVARRRKLPPEDFFNLFEDLELSEVIRDFKRLPGFHQHLDWLKSMKLDAGAAGCGCQGLNRLGRVVFFELRERIHQIVSTRLGALNDRDELQRQLQRFEGLYVLGRGSAPIIHVAASVCGGTGAGMLIDLAYNLRFWANDEFHKNADVIAHLVLPEAFTVNSERIKDKLRTVACATLEQIELLTDNERPDLPVRYPNNTTMQFEHLTAPFDYVYLLSGTAPGHGTGRQHITEMIARMIRAMTAEPAATPIAADANNKQLDILTQRTEATKRRLCFASYGLRYGVPGSADAKDQKPENLVKQWLCRDLKSLMSDYGVLPSTEQNQIDQWLTQVLDPNALTARVRVESAFNFSQDLSQPNGPKRPLIGERLNQHLDSLKKTIEQRARHEVPPHPIAEVIRRVDQGIESLVREGDARELPALLATWQTKLREQQRKLSATAEKFDTTRSKVRQDVLDQLERRARERDATYNSLDDLPLPDIDSITDRALSHAFPDLARPIVRSCLEGALDATANEIANRLRLLKHLGKSADEVLQSLGKKDLQPAGGDYFAMPLFSLDHPDEQAEAHFDGIRVRYRDDILCAFLRQFLDWDGESGMNAAKKRFETTLDELAEAMKHFLTVYQKHFEESFHKPLERHPSAHPYYQAVRRIDDGTEAQIAINQRRRFNDTLDVVVAQHPEETCIPELLKANAQRSFGSAIAADTSNGIWFQLHKFRYGFCLPALDDYEDYARATDRYLKRTNYERADFWLDPQWLRKYEGLLRWCEQAASSQKPISSAQELDPTTLYEAILEYHDTFYRSLDADISSQKDQLRNPAGVVDYYAKRDEAMCALRDTDHMRIDEAYGRALKFADDAATIAAGLHTKLEKPAKEHLEELRTLCKAEMTKHGFVVSEAGTTKPESQE